MDSSIAERIRVIDSHTEGEPTRVIVEGGPDLGKGSLAQRREVFRERFDDLRSAVVNEPRGSDVFVGGLLCEPVDASCAAGVIFFNNTGYLNMCGHGTIGVVATLAHLGRIGPGAHRIETPVGVVTATLHDDGKVTIKNVPSYRYRKGVTIDVEGHGPVTGDVAWGGNWFFLAEHDGPLELKDIERLTSLTRGIRRALEAAGITGEDGGVIDHIELCGPSPRAGVDSRNFVLCPGAAYDRSPCGTGTSAKMACLAADGKFGPGRIWRQESIVGSLFEGSVELDGDRVIPSITGRAFITAEATLIRHPDDPLRGGIRG